MTKIKNWNPADGDLAQGDVLLFRIPDNVKIDTADEIAARDNRLILAEGEITGHHHAIWLPKPALFRDDALAREAVTKREPAASIKLYRDPQAAEALIRSGQLSHARLTIGFLVVEGNTVVLRHEEHDAVRIPPGRYYVGSQSEFDEQQERRVAD